MNFFFLNSSNFQHYHNFPCQLIPYSPISYIWVCIYWLSVLCLLYSILKKKSTHKKTPPKNKPQKSKRAKPHLCFLNTFLFCLSVLISFLVSRKLRDLKEDRIPCVMPLYMILLSNYSSYLEFRGDIGRAWKCPVFFALVVATLWHPQACTHTS